jgi:SAM-dependent methyltransferase
LAAGASPEKGVGAHPQYDNARARTVLGLTPRPLEETVVEMARDMLRRRIVDLKLVEYTLHTKTARTRVTSHRCGHMLLPLAAGLSPRPATRSVIRCAAAETVSVQDLRSPEQLRSGIANFYDRSSKLWERMWGEHMHHGYYPNGERKNHRQAQVDMIDGVLEWAGVGEGPPPTSVLDVGCGIGGSTRHIARKYGCSGRGITLSPVQAARAQQLSDEQGLGEQLSFQVADALQMPFADDSFDLVWSLESGEHMPDKAQFVSELSRVAKPGGRVIIVTWCHRDLEPGGRAALTTGPLRPGSPRAKRALVSWAVRGSGRPRALPGAGRACRRVFWLHPLCRRFQHRRGGAASP